MNKPSSVSAIRTVKTFGYKSDVQRRALVSMRRRGVGFIAARRAIAIVNAAEAAGRQHEYEHLSVQEFKKVSK